MPSFSIELVGTNQKTYHGLLVIGVSTKVSGVDDPWLLHYRLHIVRVTFLIVGYVTALDNVNGRKVRYHDDAMFD